MSRAAAPAPMATLFEMPWGAGVMTVELLGFAGVHARLRMGTLTRAGWSADQKPESVIVGVDADSLANRRQVKVSPP